MIDYKRNKRVLIYDTTAVSTDKYNAGANDSANTCSRRFHYYRARSALRFYPRRDAKTYTRIYLRYVHFVVYIGRDKIIFYHPARFSLSLSLSLSPSLSIYLSLEHVNVVAASMYITSTRYIMCLTAVQTFIPFSKIRSIRRDWIWSSGAMDFADEIATDQNIN